jgi:hypothetical protein
VNVAIRASLLILPVLVLPSLARDASRADDAPSGLVVRKASVRFRKGGSGDSIRLKAYFSPRHVPEDFDPGGDTVEVAVGPQVLLSLPGSDADSRTRIKAGGKLCYRERRSPDREGVRKLVLDTRRGRVILKARRLDLTALRDAGGEGVVVTLTFADARFGDTIDFDEGRSAWRYSGPITIPGFEPPGEPPDPPDDPLPGPVTPKFRILWTYADIPCGLGIPVIEVITDPLLYDGLWEICSNPPVGGGGAKGLTTKPPVDFSEELVVLINLGIRETTGYSVTVTKVSIQVGGATVHYQETVPGAGCPVSQEMTWPFVVAAVKKQAGSLAFSRDHDRAGCTE